MEAFRLNEAEWLRYDINYIRSHVPAQPGVYALSCPKGRVRYVGKAESSVRSRLETYGSPSCHNKMDQTVLPRTEVGLVRRATTSRPLLRILADEYPAYWEALAIQMSHLASGGLNQRNEWAPLIHASDASYRVIARSILARLEGDERRHFQQSFDVRE
jgi:hypothetical protein